MIQNTQTYHSRPRLSDGEIKEELSLGEGCPICGSRDVTDTDGDWYCIDCGFAWDIEEAP
jgi:ribosomal protein L37AE/L43A